MTQTATPKRVSFLELFFDLVFVFAITQLARLLHDDHSLGGWAHAGLIAWLVWWAWSQFTWAANAIDLDDRPTRVALLAVTGLTLFAAIGMPQAFGDAGAWFAVPYVAVRLAGLAMYWYGLRADPAHRAALRSYLPLATLSPVLVLVGGLADTDARPWWWLAAVVVDVTSALAAGRGEFRVEPSHFAERHGLFVIIALGESVIATGLTAADAERTLAVAVATAAGFIVIASLWWAYFDRIHGAAERRLATQDEHRRRGRLARDLFTFLHLPIVLGPVAFAVGVEEALAHPTDPLPVFGRWAVGAGLALFLGGFVLGNLRAVGTVLVERTVGLVAVVAITAGLGPRVDAAVLLGVLAAVLVGVTAVEAARATPSPSAHPIPDPTPA